MCCSSIFLGPKNKVLGLNTVTDDESVIDPQFSPPLLPPVIIDTLRGVGKIDHNILYLRLQNSCSSFPEFNRLRAADSPRCASKVQTKLHTKRENITEGISHKLMDTK